MQMWLHMRILYHVLGCDTMNWPQLWLCIVCFLAWVVYCLMVVPSTLAILVPG